MKVILDPVDFIGFDGLTSRESLKRVVLLESRRNGAYRQSVERGIEKAVSGGKYDWNVLRIDGDGKVTRE